MNRQFAVIGLAAVGFAVVTAVFVLRTDGPDLEEPSAAVERPVVEPSSPPAAAAPEPVAPTPRPAPAAPVAEAPVAVAAPPVTEAPPRGGLLRIESDVAGAQVFIDRRFIGAAPAIAEDVTPGRHELNVSAEGYDNAVLSIDVEPGERTIRIRFREVRLDAAIDVVHKHRFGSCTGRLIATPQRFRYETDNRNDGFTTSLLELESFEVDYLDTNLRVRLDGGRTLNFTDPDGDADRLFVFHRDVENARERLSRGDPPAPD
ncbi:MAG: PEGA domain-containing protein [Acidobacteria bacterium]|nr:PEGA domain-containing protein [Acidobacteriota bacterium]